MPGRSTAKCRIKSRVGRTFSIVVLSVANVAFGCGEEEGPFDWNDIALESDCTHETGLIAAQENVELLQLQGDLVAGGERVSLPWILLIRDDMAWNRYREITGWYPDQDFDDFQIVAARYTSGSTCGVDLDQYSLSTTETNTLHLDVTFHDFSFGCEVTCAAEGSAGGVFTVKGRQKITLCRSVSGSCE